MYPRKDVVSCLEAVNGGMALSIKYYGVEGNLR
jgi:hypothetical protein